MSEELDKSIFLNKHNFSLRIEEMVLEGMTYFEAVLAFADEADKDPEELMQFMSPVLIEKLRKCAVEQGLAQPENNSIEDLLE